MYIHTHIKPPYRYMCIYIYIYGIAWEVDVGSDRKEFETSFEGTSLVLFPDQDAQAFLYMKIQVNLPVYFSILLLIQ